MIVNEALKYGAKLRIQVSFQKKKKELFNNKIDLTKAEAISKIIEARSEDAVKLLARQLKGELTNFVNEIRETYFYVSIYRSFNRLCRRWFTKWYFWTNWKKNGNKIILKLSNTLEASKRREGMIEGFKVAIIGKPNVGKSSLLNKLLNYDRAIISDIAGTTRDTIEESVK